MFIRTVALFGVYSLVLWGCHSTAIRNLFVSFSMVVDMDGEAVGDTDTHHHPLHIIVALQVDVHIFVVATL